MPSVSARASGRLEAIQAGASNSIQNLTYQWDTLGNLLSRIDATQSPAVTDEFSYDALNGADDFGETIGSSTDRGFTGHEHLQEVGLVHMNGRIYDPRLGRFMSEDPFVQDPFDTQSLNRYSYVINNPLAYTDPNGYFFKSIVNAIKNIISNPRAIIGIAAAAFIGPAVFDVVFWHLAATTANSVATLTVVADDIAANGIREPIRYVEVGGRRYVVDGHHRLQAAKELGMSKVPTRRVELPYNGYKTTNDLFNWGP